MGEKKTIIFKQNKKTDDAADLQELTYRKK